MLLNPALETSKALTLGLLVGHSPESWGWALRTVPAMLSLFRCPVPHFLPFDKDEKNLHPSSQQIPTGGVFWASPGLGAEAQ